MNSLLRIWLY